MTWEHTRLSRMGQFYEPAHHGRPGTDTVSVTHCFRAKAKPPPYWTNPAARSPHESGASTTT